VANIIITPSIFFSQKQGGISRYFSEIQKKSNNSTLVVAPCVFSNNLYLPGYSKVSLGSYGRKLSEWVNYINFQMKVTSENIVHHSYYEPKYLKSRAKVNIVTVYDCIHEKFSVDRNDSKVIQNKKTLLEKSDVIISISNTTKRDIIKYYDIDPDRIKVIYLGSGPFPQRKSTRLKLAITNPYILFVGRRDSYKNFNSLLEAFSLSNFYHNGGLLVVFGISPNTTELDSIRARCPDLIKSIHFVSGGDALLGSYYDKAYMHIVMSKYEGFGLTPLESISLKCPTMIYKNPVVEELFGETGFVFSNDSIECMLDIIDNSDINEIILENQIFKNLNPELFNWEAMRENTFKLYRSLL
jgi:glycosyltransferase involved in cell wall biosynthesis